MSPGKSPLKVLLTQKDRPEVRPAFVPADWTIPAHKKDDDSLMNADPVSSGEKEGKDLEAQENKTEESYDIEGIFK